MTKLDKKLTPNTIITNSLYVERSADKQLRDIIRDMGRPAYILVARQMGKTNLLINAIRTIKGSNDVFGYIDLSNRFDTDRECFRNIIDKILDSNVNELEDIAESIELKREGRQLVAHREHQRELREILSVITGKLIINLDEIDSLTVADYSDKIFAQIRSVYFDRINYPEFERLSYILSGVAEPSDIIKDKSISPFNIGQKILLGDFTYDEFLTLINNACLTNKIDEKIKKRVFYWTNGNPRLSWEVLSEVENIVLNNENIDESKVDEIVRYLYLTNYDRPPIDHIRSLVSNNVELREAVISIFYEETDSISKDIQNRLYLAGVLGSDYEYGDIRIKNRIVENSLDLNWLIELNKSKNVSMDKADELFSNNNFVGAIDILKNIVENESLSKSMRSNANYKLGACYFNLGYNHKTVSCYENNLFDKEGYYEVYCEQIYILGVAHSRLRNHKEAQSLFDELIVDNSSEFYHLALVGKSKVLESIDKLENKSEILRLNTLVIEDGKPAPKSALSGAYYNLANLNSAINENAAYDYYLKASDHAENLFKIKPLIQAIKINQKDFDNIFSEILITLQSKVFEFDNEIESYGLEVTLFDFSDLVALAIRLDKLDEIDDLIEAIRDYCLKDKSSLCQFMLTLALSKLTDGDRNTLEFILNKIIVLDSQYTAANPLFVSYKYLSFIDPDNEDALEHYFSRVQNYTENIDNTDVNIFERKVVKLIDNGETKKAEKYCDLIVSIEGLQTHQSRVRLLTLLFLKIRCIKNIEEKRGQASELKEIIENIKDDDLKFTTVHSDILKKITEEIDATLLSVIPVRQYIRKEARYGRNDMVKIRYQDGREDNKKYKHIMESLKKGLCEIVN